MIEAPTDIPNIQTGWKKKLTKLKDVVRVNRQNLTYQRAQRKATIRQYVGKYFSTKGSADKVPRNMIELAVNVWLSHLAAKTPQVLVSTRFRQLQGIADDFTRAMNPLIDHEMRLGDTLAQGVTEALFAPFGIIKVGLYRFSQVEIDGFMHDYNQPFADVVDLDNFVVDLSASRWDKIGFIGDRFSLDFEDVKDGGYFENTEDLSPDNNLLDQDDLGESKAKDMSRDVSEFKDVWEDQIELQELWLPKYNLTLTVAVNGDWTKPLKEIEWDGPEMGPYHKLQFNRVPGNAILGNPPLGLIRDLHEFSNTLYMKLIRRAQDSKDVVGYQGNEEQFATRVRDAQDLEFIRMDSASGLKEMRIGSPDPAQFGMIQEAEQAFDKNAGNLSLLGGLSAMTDTLGQDRLLSASAAKRMGAMQDKVLEWTKGILQSVAFYLWEDPIRTYPITQEVPGTDIKLTYGWGPEHREGNFLEYNFDIVPYSMQQQTPSEKLAAVMQLWQQMLLPMAQSGMLAAQRKSVDIGALIDLVGRYGGLQNELSQLIIDMAPTGNEEQPMGKPGRSQPVVKNVNTTRTSGSGSAEGKKTDRITQLMGGRLSPQQSQASQR